MVTPKYQRVVLKLSGEALAGDAGFGIKPPVIKEIIQEIKEVHELGVEMAIVVGGGNIWRGQSEHKWAWNALKLITWVC